MDWTPTLTCSTTIASSSDSRRPLALADSTLRPGAHDPKVADPPRRARGGRLEALAHDALAPREHGCGHTLLVGLPRQPHDEVVEHVVIGPARGLQVPGLARGQRVQRKLDVVP